MPTHQRPSAIEGSDEPPKGEIVIYQPQFRIWATGVLRDHIIKGRLLFGALKEHQGLAEFVELASLAEIR